MPKKKVRKKKSATSTLAPTPQAYIDQLMRSWSAISVLLEELYSPLVDHAKSAKRIAAIERAKAVAASRSTGFSKFTLDAQVITRKIDSEAISKFNDNFGKTFKLFIDTINYLLKNLLSRENETLAPGQGRMFKEEFQSVIHALSHANALIKLIIANKSTRVLNSSFDEAGSIIIHKIVRLIAFLERVNTPITHAIHATYFSERDDGTSTIHEDTFRSALNMLIIYEHFNVLFKSTHPSIAKRALNRILVVETLLKRINTITFPLAYTDFTSTVVTLIKEKHAALSASTDTESTLIFELLQRAQTPGHDTTFYQTALPVIALRTHGVDNKAPLFKALMEASIRGNLFHFKNLPLLQSLAQDYYKHLDSAKETFTGVIDMVKAEDKARGQAAAKAPQPISTPSASDSSSEEKDELDDEAIGSPMPTSSMFKDIPSALVEPCLSLSKKVSGAIPIIRKNEAKDGFINAYLHEMLSEVDAIGLPEDQPNSAILKTFFKASIYSQVAHALLGDLAHISRLSNHDRFGRHQRLIETLAPRILSEYEFKLKPELAIKGTPDYRAILSWSLKDTALLHANIVRATEMWANRKALFRERALRKAARDPSFVPNVHPSTHSLRSLESRGKIDAQGRATEKLTALKPFLSAAGAGSYTFHERRDSSASTASMMTVISASSAPTVSSRIKAKAGVQERIEMLKKTFGLEEPSSDSSFTEELTWMNQRQSGKIRYENAFFDSVLTKAKEHGLEKQVRLHGGALRAFLIPGQVTSDYDFEFFGSEEDLKKLFNIKKLPFMINTHYGAVNLYRGTMNFKAQAIQVDVVCHPLIDIEMQRRTPSKADFTFNQPCTYYDTESDEVYLLGPDGKITPESVTSAIETPFDRSSDKSFLEDPVLILRAMRFNAMGFTPSHACLTEIINTLKTKDFEPYRSSGQFRAYFLQYKDQIMASPLLEGTHTAFDDLMKAIDHFFNPARAATTFAQAGSRSTGANLASSMLDCAL